MNVFDAQPYCEIAIKLATEFGKNFSCSPEDITDMEEILKSIHNNYKNNKITDKQTELYASIFGIYLGQIMLDSSLAKYGYKWEKEDTILCLAKNADNKMYPVSKTAKMIVNGDEDSVKSFYKVAIAIADAKFKK